MKPYPHKRYLRILVGMTALIVLSALPSYGQSDDPFGQPPPAFDPFGEPAAGSESAQSGSDPFTPPDPPDEGFDSFGGGSSPPARPVAKAAPKAILNLAPIEIPNDWDSKSPKRQIAEALENSVEFEAIEMPLDDLVAMISEIYKIEIQIDQKALNDVGLEPSTPITHSFKGISLRSALRWTLRELQLTYIIQDELLLITTPEEAETQLITRVYPVTDLIRRKTDDGQTYDSADSLVNIITGTIRTQTYGLKPGSISLQPVQNGVTLVATQTQDIHEKIVLLLKIFRTLNKSDKSADDGPDDSSQEMKSPCSISVKDTREYVAERRIEAALRQPATIETIEIPLTDIIQQLAETHNISILIDNRALNDVGIDPSIPLTFSLNGISLRSALELILGQLDLTYQIDYESLIITTPQETEVDDPVRIYPVTDLVCYDRADGGSSYDFDMLTELITTTVSPETWPGSGPSSSSIDSMLLNNVAAIAFPQSAIVHREIEQFLQALRQTNAKMATDDSGDLPSLLGLSRGISAVDPLQRRAVRRIKAELIKPMTIEVKETPLTNLVELLAENHKIPIFLDKRALCDVGIDPSTTITYSIDGITLRSALKLILRSYELTYIMKHETLVITTLEEADTNLEIRCYPVSDLVSFKSDAEKSFVDADPLKEAISSTIEPQSWDATCGGPLTVVYLNNGAVLVASQTPDVQEEIADLLRELRKVNHREEGPTPFYHQKPEPPPPTSGGMF